MTRCNDIQLLLATLIVLAATTVGESAQKTTGICAPDIKYKCIDWYSHNFYPFASHVVVSTGRNGAPIQVGRRG